MVSNNVPSLEQQILYHNMPNATLEDIAQHIQTKAVPHNTKWTPSTLLQIPGPFETDIPDPVERGDTPGTGIPQIAGTPRPAGISQLSLLRPSATQRGTHSYSQQVRQLLTFIEQSLHMVRRVSTETYQKLGKHRATRK
jgi:hypothetical protein